MMKNIVLFILFSVSYVYLTAQQTKTVLPKTQRFADKQMRLGNEAYDKGQYADAEILYRKSIATVDHNTKTQYNLANTMMQQKRYKEASASYQKALNLEKNTKNKAQIYHNVGNAAMGLKDYQKAIDAYKSSLRINPNDEETRYNLALAQKFLKDNPQQNQPNKNQQNQQNQNQQNKDNQNNKDNKDQKDNQQNKDEKNQKDNKDGEKPKDNADQQDKDNQNAKPKTQPGQMSEQQMQQLLEALNNEEKKTQDKVKAQKVKVQSNKKEKDW